MNNTRLVPFTAEITLARVRARRTLLTAIAVCGALAAAAARATTGHEVDCCAVFELRQYTLHPGQRDTLIELFDREFVETQEAFGMRVYGQFRDEEQPDHFVWIRAFSDMDGRAKGLTSFYVGPVWKEYGKQAAATMVNSDNVLLLRPIDPPNGFNDLSAERPPVNDTTVPSSLVIATTYSLREGAQAKFAAFFRESIRPALQAAGITLRATFATEHSPNNYPALPIRTGEEVFVWFASYGGDAAYVDSMARLSESRAWIQARSRLTRFLKAAPQELHLRPTSRSLVR
jgi:quinol monooxygenase YgiN